MITFSKLFRSKSKNVVRESFKDVVLSLSDFFFQLLCDFTLSQRVELVFEEIRARLNLSELNQVLVQYALDS